MLLTDLTSVVPHGNGVVVGGVSPGSGWVDPQQLVVRHQVYPSCHGLHQLLNLVLTQ